MRLTPPQYQPMFVAMQLPPHRMVDPCSCWKDKSGSNNHIAQTDTSERPTYHKNAIYGQGGIWFDSVDDILDEGQLNGVAGGDQNHTIFVVTTNPSKGTAHNAGLFRIGEPTGKQCIGFSVNAAPLSWWHWDTNTFYDLPNSKMPNPDEAFITKMRYKGGGLSAANKYLSGNGVQLTWLSGGNSDLLNLSANPPFNLGKMSHLGYILEFIFYDKALEEADEDAIEAYLRAKWQKGVDGISTTELAAHYDAMKAETTTTDVCSTGSIQASDCDLVQCWKDRSSNANHLEQTTSGSRPTLVASNSDMGGERSLHFQSQYLQRSSSRGFPSGDDSWSFGASYDVEAYSGSWEHILKYGLNASNSDIGITGLLQALAQVEILAG